MKKKILVRGPVLSRSGYGEQARFAARSLRKHKDEYDIYLLNIGWGETGWIWEDDEERRWLDLLLIKTQHYIAKGGNFDISLQITIPNEWEKMAPINIGYTAGIESTRIAPQWIEKCDLMDKIIVVSNHAKYGFDNTVYVRTDNNTSETMDDYRNTTPIEVVHYPVRDHKPADIDLNLELDFNFLNVAQWGPRKNLENTVKWFVEEFYDKPVGLVVKGFIKNNSVCDRHYSNLKMEEMLSDYPDRKCKVYMLHGDMTDAEMTALYQHPKIKAMVSLTHGEGYGLPLFEAAYNGMPLIAPDWSGHLDFLYVPVTARDKKAKKKSKSRKRMQPMFARVAYDLKHIPPAAVWEGVLEKDSMWCYPQQGSSKMVMRDMYNNYKKYQTMAKKLETHIRKNFTQDKLYDDFVSAISSETSTQQELPQRVEAFMV